MTDFNQTSCLISDLKNDINSIPFRTACSRQVWPLKKTNKKNAHWHIVLQWSSTAYLLWETWLDESEESIYVGWFKRDTRPNVFHDLFTNSCGHKAYHISDVDRKSYQMSLDLLSDILPCCLALDGTGMLLNSFTSLTLAERRKTMATSHFNKSHFNNLMLVFRKATYKLSIMGVEVHGLCVSLCRGMDFIRWYMGGHAIRACRVWVFRVREEKRVLKGIRQATIAFLTWQQGMV